MSDNKRTLAQDGYVKTGALQEGYVRKGGTNSAQSKITVRPSAPSPMRPAGQATSTTNKK